RTCHEAARCQRPSSAKCWRSGRSSSKPTDGSRRAPPAGGRLTVSPGSTSHHRPQQVNAVIRSTTEVYRMDEREVGLQPLHDAATGRTLVFAAIGRMYQPMSALAILAALNGKGFTGVCECYLRPDVRDGEYLMGVGLEFVGEPPPDEWWGEFVGNVRHACADD